MKKNKFTFSHCFVIPTVKKSPYLENCLNSLKNQKIKSNIIITTAKPFIGIKKIAKKYNIKIIIFKKHKNIANDWNRAINSTKSNYVTIAHQDDIYNKDYLYEILNSLKKIKKNKPSIIFTDYYELKNKKKTASLKLIIKKIILSIFYYKRNLIYKKNTKKTFVSFGSPIPCPTVTFNKEYKIKFDERFWINIDWNLWIKLSQKRGPFLYIKKELVGHRIHNKSETSKAIKDGKREKEDWELFKKLWPKPLAFILSKLYKFSYRIN